MAITKLISDFDGVWTNQETEADYVWKYIVNRLSELSGFKPAEVDSLLNECKRDMDKSPQYYGWRWDSEISCYYREDPFGDNNAIFEYIEKKTKTSSFSKIVQNLALIKESILKKTENNSLADFSNECFIKSTTQFKLEGKLKPVPAAGAIVKELNKKGVEIIIASNSKTEKIEHLFRKAGQTVTNEKSIVRGRLHARGNAQKFVIDNSFASVPEKLNINKKIRVCLRRKNYYNILLEEKPDFVVGDVFSLDIALPLYLRLNDRQFGKMKVIQKVQQHTPEWVTDFLGSKDLTGIAFMIKSIDELPELTSN